MLSEPTPVTAIPTWVLRLDIPLEAKATFGTICMHCKENWPIELEAIRKITGLETNAEALACIQILKECGAIEIQESEDKESSLLDIRVNDSQFLAVNAKLNV